MRLLTVLLMSALLVAVPIAGSGAASPAGSGQALAKKKKCPKGYIRKGKRCRKKRKPNTTIVSGRYQDMNGLIYFDVDTKAKGIKYWFSIPCTNGNPETVSTSHFSNRDEPISVGLPGSKVGTKLAIDGQREEDSNAYPGAKSSYKWTIDAKFTRRNVLSGTVHLEYDLPPYSGEFTYTGSHCEQDVQISTAAPLR